MEITLRQAQPEDVSMLVRLSEQLGYAISTHQVEENLRFLLQSDVDEVIVAETDGVVGWIHLFKAVRVESVPFAEIGGFVVDEGVRGQGVGTRLLEEACQWTLTQGLQRLRVRTNTIREETLQFYLNRQFSLKKTQNVLEIVPFV